MTNTNLAFRVFLINNRFTFLPFFLCFFRFFFHTTLQETKITVKLNCFKNVLDSVQNVYKNELFQTN